MVALAGIFGWPILLYTLLGVHPGIATLIFLLNAGVAVTVWRQSSSPALSFFDGLTIIASRMMSGCANITVLYAPLILVGFYLVAVWNTARGLARGREFAQLAWIKMVTEESTAHDDQGHQPRPILKCSRCSWVSRNANVDTCARCGSSLVPFG